MYICLYQRGGLAGVAEGRLDERARSCSGGSSSVGAGQHHSRRLEGLALLDKGCGVRSELSQSWKTPLRKRMEEERIIVGNRMVPIMKLSYKQLQMRI